MQMGEDILGEEDQPFGNLDLLEVDPLFFDSILDDSVPFDFMDELALTGSLGDPTPITTEEPPMNMSHDRAEWTLKDSNTKRLRSPKLFEFLIMLLQNDKYQCYASFIDRSKGTFCIHEPAKVAELWQLVKTRQSNQKMTYDKFARAVRWYYKSNIMEKTNTRYTFQFSPRILKKYFQNDQIFKIEPSCGSDKIYVKIEPYNNFL